MNNVKVCAFGTKNQRGYENFKKKCRIVTKNFSGKRISSEFFYLFLKNLSFYTLLKYHFSTTTFSVSLGRGKFLMFSLPVPLIIYPSQPRNKFQKTHCIKPKCGSIPLIFMHINQPHNKFNWIFLLKFLGFCPAPRRTPKLNNKDETNLGIFQR